MYQHSLLLEQLRVDRDRELARSATWSRRPQPEPAAKPRRRSWWPRPRHSALRLAMAGLPAFRTSRKTACADC
jgi:hypothetical protein